MLADLGVQVSTDGLGPEDQVVSSCHSGPSPAIQCLHLAKEGCCLWGPKWLRVTAPSLGPLGRCPGSLPTLYHGRYLSGLEKLKAGREVLVLTNGKKKINLCLPHACPPIFINIIIA